jgi:ribosomal-protein-alanine N-acetyltransferase
MIERADQDQSELLAELHAQAFAKSWSAPEIAKLLENPAVFAILSRDPEPQGFVMAWAAAADSEILTLAVVPGERRKGVGAALATAAGVAALVRGAASVHLEVAENNAPARALYRKLGYEEAGRRRDYYFGEGGAVDALVLKRNLPRPNV